MRCFVAVDIDDGTQGRIERYQKQLRQEANFGKGAVKWVEPSNIHLTLKFLGEVEDKNIMEVCSAVEAAAGGVGGFEVRACGVGFFGASPRVLWVGVDGGKTLEKLATQVESELGKVGFAPEGRKFEGHLTLCRIKNSKAGRILKELVADAEQADFGTFWVDSVCVYKSTLTSGGPEYNVVSRIFLK